MDPVVKFMLVIGIVIIIGVSGCTLYGLNTYSMVDGELIGQAKKLITANPIICPGYPALDISLGVMQNGTGSISGQDIWFTVRDVQDVQKMKDAVEHGSLVKVHYDLRRITICTEDHIATGFEVVK